MENKMNDLCEELLELIENETSIKELTEELEKSEIEIMGLINFLKNQGLNIVVVNKDDGIYVLNQGERRYSNDYKYSFITDDNNTLSFLVISDTRLGSVFFQKSILNELYQHAYEMGIKNVILTGNITEGLYKLTNNMIDTLVAKDTMSQAKYVIDNFPYINGMKTYFINGKKDQTHLRENKIDIGKQISSQRDDLIFIGNSRCMINVDNVKMLILNRKQIKTYTQSYRAQKLIDAMRSEDKPNILLYGGLLQCDKYLYRDVEVMSIPSVCASTWEMEEKEYSNTIGGWYVKIETDKRGNLKSLKSISDIYYNTNNQNYKKTKTLKIEGGK